MLSGIYGELYGELIKNIQKNRIFQDPLYTLAYGTDASFYRLIPKIVVLARDEPEIIFILKTCSRFDIPVTFRAAGTSLSGQSVSDSVLVIAGCHWKKYRIWENGKLISLQPGITGGKANALLAPYDRKIGPDPASVNAAMIGGIAANNASGMCCGTAENSYKTLSSMRLIFQDGTLLDTSDPESRNAFKKSHPHLLNEIKQLINYVKNNQPLSERISHKFRMKNTTGYSLNALVDFDDPFEVIEHLMIGSEGTLGFISEITYHTVPELPHKASSLMIYPDIERACNAVALLKKAPVSAVELIDRAGLRSVENQKGMPGYLKTLTQDACAILVETRADSIESLQNQINTICEIVSAIPSELPVTFTDKFSEYEIYWKIRKGLFPSVGAMRNSGTTVIIEDVAVPVERLANATLDLQNLLKKWGYNEAVIFGHALEGNLHFVFTQDFSHQDEIDRYSGFMAEIAEMVTAKYDGSLKAEHGTGRNMAPFVEMEWGNEACNLMKRIKEIFDPRYLLNPGVILNNDPRVHLKNLKPIPPAHELVDKCIECGFCEPSCVSAGLTLSPRQRIAVYREIQHLVKTGHEPHLVSAYGKLFGYAADETCATDGLCALACPVGIDTGKLVKTIRHTNTSGSSGTAMKLATNMKSVTGFMRAGLTSADLLHRMMGTTLMYGFTGLLRRISFNTIPLWNKWMPRGAHKVKLTAVVDNAKKVVCFPSCINRSMGVSQPDNDKRQLTDVMATLLKKAGFELIYPEHLDSLCCGMAFSSKGYFEAGKLKSDELEKSLIKASENGKYPVLCDMSPCLYTMKENFGQQLTLFEPVEFILEYLLPELEIVPVNEPVAVFAVCSAKKMGLEKKLVELAKICASEVILPETNCCGFAGDRGFSYPELNLHGLKYLKNQIPGNIKLGYSTSRTCEIGLSLHSGISFQSIVYLVDKVSRPKKSVV